MTPTHHPTSRPGAGATGGRPIVGRRIRVITQNVWAHAPSDLAQTVVETLLALDPDAVGLQEWPNGRNRILKGFGPFRRLPATHAAAARLVRRVTGRPWKDCPGYVSVRPIMGPTGPMMFRGNRFEITRVFAKTLSKARRVKGTKRHPRTRKPANRATVVETFDHVLNRRTVFINYHLWAGVQFHGHYSTASSARERVVGHKIQVSALEQLIADYLATGWDVYPLGDSNFSGLRLHGVTSAWDGREHSNLGTHGDGHRKIDDIFGPCRADDVRVIEHKSPKIDHGGVVADRDWTAA